MKKVAVLRFDSIEEIPTSNVIGGDVAAAEASAPESPPPPAFSYRRRSLRSVMTNPQSRNYSSTVQLLPDAEPSALPLPFALDVAALMAMGVSLANIWRLPSFIQFAFHGNPINPPPVCPVRTYTHTHTHTHTHARTLCRQ